MLNGKFALALAAAMVLATLYGCSSSGGIKNDRDEARTQVEELTVDLATANGVVATLQNQIFGEGGTAAMPTADSLMGMLAASGTSNTGLMNRIYGDGGTAEMPTADSLMGMLAASGMSNTGLMNQIYGDGGTAEMPTDDSLMGRLAASGMSNTALMNRIYGDGGTAEMPIAGSLMAEVTRLGNIANDGDGDGENDAVTLLNGRVAGFETAAASTVGAVNAGNAATTALGTATDKSGKIDARSPTVVGDSRMAQANAQAVLDAQRNAKGAVITAQTAVNNAKAALAADADPEDSLTKALNAAITVAEDNLRTAMAIADGKALKDAVELVTGDNPDAEGYPMTPAEHGEEVAMDIGGALGPMSPIDGSRTRGEHETTDTNVPDAMDNADADNHVGSTWEEIVGAANIKQMRIASAVDDTNVVSAASIAGQATSSVDTVSDLDAGGLGNGKQHDGTYKGIPGTVFCAGTDCAVTMTDDGDTLTGSWYFNPDDKDEWYVRNAADTAYIVETLYARFGHWLAANSTTPANTDVNTYAVTGKGTDTNTDNLDVTTVRTGADATTLTDTKATYEGMAAGMALHKQFDNSGMILEGTLRSTAFTADVELTATFGVGATLGGKIMDFEDTAGKDIDRSWEVELLTRSFNGMFDNGTAVASAQDGVWTAQAFGVRLDRPTGVFGGFNAHFTNGHVAGAYATRK